MRSSDGPGLSIVVPVYNGAATIGKLVEALSDLAPVGGLEIVLVNDGSPDESHQVCSEIVRTARVPIVYVRHMRNYGEHNAVLTGLREASGAYIITMDDDLQNPPEEVVKLYDYTRLNKFDVVYTRYATKKHDAWRNIGSKFANWIADQLLDKPQGLYLSSFRCVAAEAAKAAADYKGPYPYIDGLLMQVTQNIGSVEVLHLPREEGRSNYTIKRLLDLWLNLATCFSLAPLRIAVWTGSVMALLGGLGALGIVWEALTRGTPPGWAFLAVTLLVVGGVQCMMLGIIGEYVGRTFLAASGKPQSVAREVVRSSSALVEPPSVRTAQVVSL